MNEAVQQRHRKALATRQAMAALGGVVIAPAPPGNAVAQLQHKLDVAVAVITALELALQSNVELQARMERRDPEPGSNIVRREAKDLASAALQLVARARPQIT